MALARTVVHAHRRACSRGGKVRILCRDGGLGDVLWAAAAAQACAEQHRAQDELLFLTQQHMVEAARLAAPTLPIIQAQLASPLLGSLLRRFMSVQSLDYEPHDLGSLNLWQCYLQALDLPALPPPERWHFPQRPEPRTSLSTAYIYAGPSWAVRELPPATWQEVVRRLHEELHWHVLQILPADDMGRRISGVDGFIIDETLPALCNLFDQSAVVITIDSIMLHLAAGTRAPVVGLFGPTAPASRLHGSASRIGLVSDIPCAGCHHQRPRLHWESGCPHDISCMSQLDAGIIFNAVQHLTGQRASPA